MKRAARLAELEAKPGLTRAEAWEAQELRRELRTNAALKLRYRNDPAYRRRKLEQQRAAYVPVRVAREAAE